MESGRRGISVVEIPPRGQRIPVSRESVTAFIGPTPRGPVNIPVAIRSHGEFLARFGVPGCLSRLEFLLAQYFENGGTLALVVRVCRTSHRKRIVLPGSDGELVLEALYPGPLEHLRAAVDYDGIGEGEPERFNLVIHRCRSVAQPLVEEQEIHERVTVLPEGPDFIGDALAGSALVRLAGELPRRRPAPTDGGSRYVYGRSSWEGDNAPTDYDLIGSREDCTGLFALEQAPWVDFIHLVPGVSGADLGPVAVYAAERYCRERHAFLLLDPPAGCTRVADIVRRQRQRAFASPDAVTWFPQLEAVAPARPGEMLSAAGAIAGALCAAGPGAAGPLPLVLAGMRPAVVLEESDVHRLTRLGVNALARPSPGRPELAGLVTMARFAGVAASWNALPERRTASFAVSSIVRHTRWACFEAPGEPLWREVREQVAEFLSALQARGLLAGTDAAHAFYVKCDVDTHGGRPAHGSPLVLVFGLALSRPGEFAAFRVTQTAFDSAVTELAWPPGLALAG